MSDNDPKCYVNNNVTVTRWYNGIRRKTWGVYSFEDKLITGPVEDCVEQDQENITNESCPESSEDEYKVDKGDAAESSECDYSGSESEGIEENQDHIEG